MNAAEVDAAFDAFVTTQEGSAYISSAEFERLAEDLFAKLDAEEMTVEQCAAFIKVPTAVFVYMYADYLAAEVISMGTPPSGSIN